MHQRTARADFHNKTHMSHTTKKDTGYMKRHEALLNLTGNIRKGVATETDLGSSLQRWLVAVGLVVPGDEGTLTIRNRLYEKVFTARWANENLPLHWRGPAIAVGIILAFIAIPFWYTQILPRPYVRVLSSPTADIEAAATAFRNLRSFPGHTDVADRLIQIFLQGRARRAEDRAAIGEIEQLARRLPVANDFADNLVATFWDGQVANALRNQNRDDALLAALEALVLSTPVRRRRAATL